MPVYGETARRKVGGSNVLTQFRASCQGSGGANCPAVEQAGQRGTLTTGVLVQSEPRAGRDDMEHAGQRGVTPDDPTHGQVRREGGYQRLEAGIRPRRHGSGLDLCEVGAVFDVCAETQEEAFVAGRLTGDDQRPHRCD